MKIFQALTWFTEKLRFIEYVTKSITSVKTTIEILKTELETIWLPYTTKSKTSKNEVKKSIVNTLGADSPSSIEVQKQDDKHGEITKGN
jgi:hypothetical protein